MCSFLILNWLTANIEYINFFLKFRGPDATNIFNYENFIFLHNLLHLTGEFTKQPFIDNDNKIICLFNGEIYNYKDFGDYLSDGYCLIDLYKKYGENFIKKLDGEFSIVLFDFYKDIFIISTDVFATKPIWYSIDNNKLGISSYSSGLERAGLKNVIKLLPNTSYIFNISSLEIIKKIRVFEFNFTQFKPNYDDWCNAFINSVSKRTDNNNYNTFVCLSSGYDSGSICNALNIIKKKYDTYTIVSNENINILKKRFEKNKELSNNIANIVNFTKNEFNETHNYIKTNAEKFLYNIKTMGDNKYVTDDAASVGMSKICKIAYDNNQRIYLSGQGADEIHSDYGMFGKPIYSHSNFGGKWPDDLSTILSNNPEDNMIWKSFYGGTQKDYLAKEEIISGLHGIEGRYPFLDKYVVQEFLFLKKELKNNIYKAPLEYFMNKYNYPFDKSVKLGFSPNVNLK